MADRGRQAWDRRMIPGPLVGAPWLAEHAGEVVVADVRWYLDGRSGRSAHEAGHLPGAVFVDLNRWLAGPPSPGAGRHPLPDPGTFAAGMSELGIGDGDPVIAYDDAGGAVAARLVWLLRSIGHPAALLDGGIAAWSGPLETGPAASRAPASFTPQPWPTDRLADPDELERATGNRVVVDARAPARYRGEEEPIDARAGHIPGAVNLPFAGNLDPATKRFLPAAALRRRFETKGIGPGTDVVAYCGSGVTACHDLIALEVAGLGPGRLYAGSWSQWAADPARHAARGED